ncbi:MAG: hypothetical protein QOI59_5282 [Gammaproteobacteria bacterium]|jgi:hypothetical protein|nr:hypothetical protein [Gammaproteobacteria bacterium]
MNSKNRSRRSGKPQRNRKRRVPAAPHVSVGGSPSGLAEVMQRITEEARKEMIQLIRGFKKVPVRGHLSR